MQETRKSNVVGSGARRLEDVEWRKRLVERAAKRRDEVTRGSTFRDGSLYRQQIVKHFRKRRESETESRMRREEKISEQWRAFAVEESWATASFKRRVRHNRGGENSGTE